MYSNAIKTIILFIHTYIYLYEVRYMSGECVMWYSKWKLSYFRDIKYRYACMSVHCSIPYSTHGNNAKSSPLYFILICTRCYRATIIIIIDAIIVWIYNFSFFSVYHLNMIFICRAVDLTNSKTVFIRVWVLILYSLKVYNIFSKLH